MTGPIVAGSAVIVTDEWLKVARQAALIADSARRRSGLPASRDYMALAQAFTAAMSATGHTVTPADVETHDWSLSPTVTVENAAEQLRLGTRQVRRLAPKLGGRKTSGVWLLDQTAITEHMEGQK